MSTKAENKLKKLLNEKFEFDLDYETRMIMYRLLSEVQRLMEEKNISKKELASKIGTSSSYITQLFRGNKIINLATIAKMQDALNFKFEITAKHAFEANYSEGSMESVTWYMNRLHAFDKNGFWVSSCDESSEHNDDYSSPQKITEEMGNDYEGTLKVA